MANVMAVHLDKARRWEAHAIFRFASWTPRGGIGLASGIEFLPSFCARLWCCPNCGAIGENGAVRSPVGPWSQPTQRGVIGDDDVHRTGSDQSCRRLLPQS